MCAAAIDRIALTVGNDTYRQLPALRSAAADSELFSQFLKQFGFESVSICNAHRRNFNRALGSFCRTITASTVCVFWFSGHGVQYKNRNFLIPIDASIENTDDLEDEAIDLDRILERLANSRPYLSIIFIDACRNNPFRSHHHRGIGLSVGLGVPSAPDRFMIIYSAGAHQVALDSTGDRDPHPNGLFLRELLPALRIPGISLDRAVKNARRAVRRKARALGYDQSPAIYDQTDGDFFLIPGAASEASSLEVDFINRADTYMGTTIPPAPPKVRHVKQPFLAIDGVDATPAMIKQCVLLDSQMFELETCASFDQCIEWWTHNPNIYLLVIDRVHGHVAGYLNYMALSDSAADKLLSGHLIDPEIRCDDIYLLEVPGLYRLFVCSIVVHPAYRFKGALKILFEEFLNRVHYLSRQEIYFKDIIADAFTIQGRQLCVHVGMEPVCETNHSSTIYRVSMIPPRILPVTDVQRRIYARYRRKAEAVSDFPGLSFG